MMRGSWANKNLIVTWGAFDRASHVTYHHASQVCKYDIEESISREMSGDLKDGMLTIGMYSYGTQRCIIITKI
jgi:hypothetical protein